MLGVLIVDDEMIVRYGIKSMINWGELGLSVVGDASNGKEALELFNLYKPQIVITDIKMPVMNGIELMKNIRKINTEVKIIILSCLQDFVYAKEAISLGATDYLVKSDMMPKDMENVLRKAIDTIEIEKEKLEQINIIQQELKKAQFVDKEKFLWELCLGAISKDDVVSEIIDQLKLSYLNGSIYFKCVQIDGFQKLTMQLSEKDKNTIENSVLDCVSSELKNDHKVQGEIFKGDRGEVNIILKVLNSKSENDRFTVVHSLGVAIIKAIKEKAGYSVSIGLSNLMEDIFTLREGYSQAHNACKFKTFFGEGRIINYIDTIKPNVSNNEMQFNIKILQDYVYSLNKEEVKKTLEDVFEKITKSMDLQALNIVALELVLVLCSVYSEIYINADTMLEMKKEYYDQLKYLENISDYKNWFKEAFEKLIGVVGHEYNSEKNSISKSISYINTNYSRKLTLQTVSDYVHLSKNYFVNLFKRETGENFIEYLTKVRVENAKALIKNSKLKTSDISAMVGIDDQRYFSKVFKKYTSMTPSEFKEKCK